MAERKIDELVTLLPPPQRPVQTAIDWPSVEGELGLPLPEDYKQIVGTYGRCLICEVIYIIHPADRLNGSLGAMMTSLLDHTINAGSSGRENVTYPDYPVPGGLLPVARIFENILCWITDGPPDKWRLLYWGEFGREVFEFDLTLGEFMVDVLNRKHLDLVPNSWIEVGSDKRQAEAMPSV